MATANQIDEACPDEIRNWLGLAVEAEASDLHLVPGYPPTLRVHGRLRQLDSAQLAPDALRDLLAGLCPAYALGRFRPPTTSISRWNWRLAAGRSDSV